MERNYDIIVIGAGHAGAEAALAAARMGHPTLMITGNLDTICQMSCNPAIGGLAKGHLVREIDALGGEMAVNIDLTGIHYKMLNKSKGPAVWAPRAQADKKAYQFRMKEVLETESPHSRPGHRTLARRGIRQDPRRDNGTRPGIPRARGDHLHRDVPQGTDTYRRIQRTQRQAG